MKLREYQLDTTAKVRGVSPGSAVCVQAPTGAGKSVMMADLLRDATPQIVLTHRRVLLDQLSATMKRYGIEHGLRAAGKRTNFAAPIQLAMIQSEFNNAYKKTKWPRHRAARLHIDEIHTVKADTAQTIIDDHRDRGCTLVGWTATPREIGHVVDRLIVSATVPELIEQGHLVQPVVYGPDMPDMARLEKVAKQGNGEYSPTALKKVWKAKKIFARVLENYYTLNPGCPAILFAPGVPESLWFAQHLTAHGVRSAHIDGKNVWIDGQFYKSDVSARTHVFDGIANGDIKIVCNRFVLREGFDSPRIGHAILACPFGARSSFVQAAGRVLRPYMDREHAIIQDHGGNWLQHPALDCDQPWELDVPERIIAAERRDKLRDQEEPEPIVCPQCNAVRISGAACPVCGYESHAHARMVIQVDGTLRKVSGRAYRQRRIRPSPDDEQRWVRAFHGNRRNNPDRTFEQVYTYCAMKNDWKFMPRDLPYMPIKRRHWYMGVGHVPVTELR